MKPIIYYYPERLLNMAIMHAKGWGRSFESRTYRTENGDTPCIDVKDSEGDTLYLLIICDDLYMNADRSERMTFENRYLLIYLGGERSFMAITRNEAMKEALLWCKDNGKEWQSFHQIR
jgi:hypothetical protein